MRLIRSAPIPVGERDIAYRARKMSGGVVDDPVDAPVPLKTERDEPTPGVGLGQIEGEGSRLPARCRGLVEKTGVARLGGEHELGALAREPLGDGAADARAMRRSR